MHVTVYTQDAASSPLSLEYEEDTPVEVLKMQIFSLLDSFSEILLLDAHGCEVLSPEDVLGICEHNHGEMWVFDNTINRVTCTSLLLSTQQQALYRYQMVGNKPFNITFRILDTEFCVCANCAMYCVDSSVLSSKPTLTPMQCNCSVACEFGLGLNTACSVALKGNEDGPLSKYLKRKLFDEIKDTLVVTDSSFERELHQRLQQGCQQMQLYETPSIIAAARQVIDYRTIISYAEEYSSMYSAPDVCLMHGLMKWFKRDYFKWCDRPSCSNPECGAKPGRMEGAGVVGASAEEQQGWASRTELYRCKDCGHLTRYPRYNHPIATLLSRRGRCGEFANAFCLVCRALGIDAHWVLDFTDHVWVEVYLPSMRQYVHADPCERKLDKPLVYEKGWNKKLSYVIAFSRCGVQDVTARYTTNIVDVQSRRKMKETDYLALLRMYDAQQEQRYSSFPSASAGPLNGDNWNFRELYLCGSSTAPLDADKNTLLLRKKRNQRCLLRLLFRAEVTATSGESEGRITGDQAWKVSRGEQGGAANAAITEPVQEVLPFMLPGCIVNTKYIDICIFTPGDGTAKHLYGSSKSLVTLEGLSVVTQRNSGYSVLIVCGVTGAVMHCCYYSEVEKAKEATLIHANRNTIVIYAQHDKNNLCADIMEKCTAQFLLCVLRDAVDNCSIVMFVPQSMAIMANMQYMERCEMKRYVLAKDNVGAVYKIATTNGEFAGRMVNILCQNDPSSESWDQFKCRISSVLLSRQDIVGVTLYQDENCGIAVFYSSFSGLSRSNDSSNATSFVKTIDTLPSDCCTSAKVLSICQYVPIGGKLHGDTVLFDTTSSVDRCFEATLMKVHLWGDMFANGVQCEYAKLCGKAEDITISSPKFLGACDNPSCTSIALSAPVIVGARCGDIIDRVSVTSGEECIRIGGSGGSNAEVVVVPSEWRLHGFGGHLHKIGVVLRAITDSQHISEINVSPLLMQLASAYNLASQPFVNSQFQMIRGTASTCLHSDLLYLCDLVHRLCSVNSIDVTRQCISTTATYLSNIIKNSTDLKYRSIRVSNASFRHKITDVVCGIEFFCYGPAYWHWNSSMLKSDIYLAAQDDRYSSTSRKDWLQALSLYEAYLKRLMEALPRIYSSS